MKRYKLVIPDKIDKKEIDTYRRVENYDGNEVFVEIFEDGKPEYVVVNHQYAVLKEWLQEIKEPMDYAGWLDEYKKELGTRSVTMDTAFEVCWKAAVKSERMAIGKQPDFSIFCMTEGIDHKDVGYTKVEMTTDGHCSESINARTGKKYKLVEVE